MSCNLASYGLSGAVTFRYRIGYAQCSLTGSAETLDSYRPGMVLAYVRDARINKATMPRRVRPDCPLPGAQTGQRPAQPARVGCCPRTPGPRSGPLRAA